jgi:hypothetical protein
MGIFNWKKKKQDEEKYEQGVQTILAGIKASKETGKAIEEESKDKKAEKQLKHYGTLMYRHFAKKLDIKLSESDMPFFKIERKRNVSYSQGNIIGITPEALDDTGIWGEEIAHNLRKRLRPGGDEGEERHSAEFFGFLGRRLSAEFFGEEYTPDAKTKEVLTREKVLENLKFQKEQSEIPFQNRMKIFHETGKLPKAEPFEIKARELRESHLHHHRPYNFASRVDISRISNWKKLFSMPDREVRMRFFRSDPDYSGL